MMPLVPGVNVVYGVGQAISGCNFAGQPLSPLAQVLAGVGAAIPLIGAASGALGAFGDIIGDLGGSTAAYPEIALGKFASDTQELLAPFTTNLSNTLGRPITYYNQWNAALLGVGSSDYEVIIAAMQQANRIHFNLEGVNWGQAMSGGGGWLSAEWELKWLADSQLLHKVQFYFPK